MQSERVSRLKASCPASCSQQTQCCSRPGNRTRRLLNSPAQSKVQFWGWSELYSDYLRLRHTEEHWRMKSRQTQSYNSTSHLASANFELLLQIRKLERTIQWVSTQSIHWSVIASTVCSTLAWSTGCVSARWSWICLLVYFPSLLLYSISISQSALSLRPTLMICTV